MKDEEGEKDAKKGYEWEVQDCKLELQPMTSLTLHPTQLIFNLKFPIHLRS